MKKPVIGPYIIFGGGLGFLAGCVGYEGMGWFGVLLVEALVITLTVAVFAFETNKYNRWLKGSRRAARYPDYLNRGSH